MATKRKSDDEQLIEQVEGNKHEELAKAIAELKPEEAAFFLAKLEALMQKRKIQITGYLVALFVWLLAMFGALLYYGTHDGFVGWVFLLPFLIVGVIMYTFGRWAEKAGKNVKVTETPKK